MSKSEAKPKKVIVGNGDSEKSSLVKVKKERVFREKKRIKENISRFYQGPFDHLERPASLSGRAIFWLIILTLIVGFFSGVLGSIFVFSRDSITLPWGEEIDLTRYFPEKQVTKITEKNVTVSSDVRIAQLTKNLEKSVVKIFAKRELGESPPFLEQIYAPWQVKMIGVFISSDGWILTARPLPEGRWEVLTNDRKIYEVEKVITDKETGVSFLKIDGVDMPALKFAPFSDITKGLQVVLTNKFLNWYSCRIANPRWRHIAKTEDLVRSTDHFSESIILDGVSPINFPGALLFDLKAQLVGLIGRNNIVIPSWQIENIVRQIAEGKEPLRISLGLDYLLIEEAPGLRSALFKDLSQGAIVYGGPFRNSPAYLAGLRNADVIVKIDGKNLNKSLNLTYLIQQKTISEKIDLTILRRGEEKQIAISL